MTISIKDQLIIVRGLVRRLYMAANKDEERRLLLELMDFLGISQDLPAHDRIKTK